MFFQKPGLYKFLRFDKWSDGTEIIIVSDVATSKVYVLGYKGKDKANFELAIKKEVEKHLVKIAKEKGFVDGLNLNNVVTPYKVSGFQGVIGEGGNWAYYPETDLLEYWAVPIYNKGEWSTIKPTEKVFTVHHNDGDSFEVIIKKDGIHYGSSIIKVQDLQDLIDGYKLGVWLVRGTSFNIGCKTDISRTTLEELIEEAKSLQ